MPIVTGGGFIAATGDPIDNRIVGTTSVLLSNLQYSYDGLNCYLTDLKKLYSFNQTKYNLFISGGGTPSISNVFQYWDIVSGGGVLQFNNITSFPNIGDPSILYVDQSNKLSYYWLTQSSTYSCTVDIFTYNPTVYLGPSYSFGRFTNGSVIPAIGKTPQQVILDAISQPLTPIVNISVIPTTIPYNTLSIIATVSVSYTIRSSGATAAVGTVSYGTSTPNTFLTNKIGPTSTYTNTFTQSITYSSLSQTIIYYNYDVTDTQGAESNSNGVINMTAYSQPTISLFASRTNPQSLIQTGETDTNREMGNIGTTLSSSAIIINSPLVPLEYYQLYYSNDGSVYNTIGSTISINSGSSIGTTFSGGLSPTTPTGYFKLKVADLKYPDINATLISTITSPINFYYPFFYGMTTVYDRFGITSSVGLNSLSKLVISRNNWISTQNQTVNLNGDYAYLYFMYPSSYGRLTQIQDSNLTDNTGNFTYSIVNINSPLNYWSNANYYIYVYYSNLSYKTSISNKAWKFQF